MYREPWGCCARGSASPRRKAWRTPKPTKLVEREHDRDTERAGENMIGCERGRWERTCAAVADDAEIEHGQNCEFGDHQDAENLGRQVSAAISEHRDDHDRDGRVDPPGQVYAFGFHHQIGGSTPNDAANPIANPA